MGACATDVGVRDLIKKTYNHSEREKYKGNNFVDGEMRTDLNEATIKG